MRQSTRRLSSTTLALGALLGICTTVCGMARPAAAQTFKILTLTTNNPRVIDVDNTAGDDNTSIATSDDRVFYTGNNATGIYPYDLSTTTVSPTRYTALTSDLLSSRVYSLSEGSGPITNENSTRTITQLIEVDGTTGATTANVITLSTPIAMDSGSGLFAGFGRIVIVGVTNAFSIDPETGVVTDLGAFNLTNNATAENVSWTWGVAEFFDGAVHLAYFGNGDNIVRRARVPDNVQETIATIDVDGDSDTVFTVAPFAGRYFVHHENDGIFDPGGNIDEVLAAADATFQLPIIVTNTNDSGDSSLRDVITLLNRVALTSINVPAITFAIPGAGPHVINLTSPLPPLNRAITIDGTTQPGFSGTPLITLNGSSAGAGANGLTLASSGSIIRGLTITNFSGDGIAVTSGSNNRLTDNSIFNNGGLGIDLGPDGPTANDNDTADADAGANDLQNAPVLSSVSSSSGSTTINGTLNSRNFTTFTLQFFSNAQADPSGFGEGQTLFGSQTVTTNAFGIANFTATLPVGVTAGEVITATATDANDNTSEFSNSVAAIAGSLAFSAATATVVENAGNATITVTRTGGSGGAVVVNFTTTDGTATAGSDYTSTSGTLTFANGETSKTITVPILNDALNEANETLTLTLSNPTNGAALGAQSTLTLTIVDDDGLPQIMVNDVSLTEGNSGTKNAVFTVTLSTSSARTVTVAFATADNTARTVLDFTRTTGTLSFAPGETSKTVSVPVVGDTEFEANETFFLALSDAGNAGIADGEGTGTILNDDANPTPPVVVGSRPTISFSAPLNGEILRTLDSIFGTVRDDETVRVQVAIQRETDGKYFTGRDFSPAFTLLTANVSNGVWTLPDAFTPEGMNLRDGKYNLTAYATDASNNTSQAYALVRIDGTPPVVSITNLKNGDVINALPLIAGRAADPLGGTGTTRVLLFIKRSSDGKYFTGRNYSLTPTALSTTVRGTTFTRNGSAAQPLPAGANLTPGTYFVTAVAFDAAGNRSSTTIAIVVSSTRPGTGT